MNDARDIVDIHGVNPSGAGAEAVRPYLSVQFDCCKVYLRIYRDPDGKKYTARCPRCGKKVNFLVGEGGTNARFFVVS